MADGMPWYPTISGECDRCGGKYRCVEFCPHGVYTLSEDGEVLVSQPLNCIPGCTGCAPICPSHAIKFPTPTGMVTCACGGSALPKKADPFRNVACQGCGKTFLTDIDGKTMCFECEARLQK